MESPYQIKIVPCDNGERFPLLVNRDDGMPLFHPCVYLSSQVRSAGRQDATLEVRLRAIKFLYNWSFKNHFDIENRFNSGAFLTIEDIDDLMLDVYTCADKLLESVSPENEGRTIPTRKKVA